MTRHRHITTLLVLGTFLFTAPARPARADCSGTYVDGLTPLTDLGTGAYMGDEGGLYPGGGNTRPAAHEAAGLDIARTEIVPRDVSGMPDPSGAIVMISIGMSNTTAEFSTFVPMADADPDKNPRLVIVDGAQGGQDATDWIRADQPTWDVVEMRLTRASVTAAQVQVVWLKQAIAGGGGAWPSDVETLRAHLATILTIARMKYPNLRLAYVSSRNYAGYATTTLNPEPFAYETGIAVKRLVRDQISGAPELAYEGAGAAVPWISWGPYFWANGLGSDRVLGGAPGRSDGVEWECSDFQSDGTHPSDAGRARIAGMLLAFFKSDSTAVPWFTASGSLPDVDAGVPPDVDAGAPGSDGGTPPASDAGPAPRDGATTSPMATASESSGCGCRIERATAGGAETAIGAALGMVVLALARRRTRTAGRPTAVHRARAGP